MRRTVAAAVVAVTAVAAFAGDSEVKLKGVGTAKVRWNAVEYREELVAQLAPGLTWRMGKDGPTRLALDKMALVGPNSMLLPGEMTLNLRYWSQDRWELVVFEERRHTWSATANVFALIPTEVGKDAEEKKFAKRLTLELRDTTKKKRSPTPGAVITGKDEGEVFVDRVSDDVAYSEASQQEFDEVPCLELHLRFGPHHALVRFEAVKVGTAKGKRPSPTGGKPDKLKLTYAKHPAVAARTEWIEKHDGELTFAVLERGELSPLVLTLTGGEEPHLWPVRRKNNDELDPIVGKRVATKRVPKTLEAELKDNVLTVHMANVDYVFDL